MVTPTAMATRPTSQRVREAVFGRLDHLGALEGARVLDLYCGAGSLGLEAVSRGAASVVLVDIAKAATAAAARNVRTLAVPEAHVVTADVAKYLARLRQSADPATGTAAGAGAAVGVGGFDLVLVDPPYQVSERDLAGVLAALADGDLVCPGGLVVVERATRSPEPTWPPPWGPVSSKRYGETTVWYADVGSRDASPVPADDAPNG